MRKIIRFWKIIVIDALGVVFMVLAVLTGWLPGPGGIPLFIIGLSLLAINHDWAQRYIELLKKYANSLGDVIFIADKRLQVLYDILAPLALITGVLLLWNRLSAWMIPAGVFLFFIGLTFLLGNRGRWGKIKKTLTLK